MGYPSVLGWGYVLPLWQLIKHPTARQRLAVHLLYASALGNATDQYL